MMRRVPCSGLVVKSPCELAIGATYTLNGSMSGLWPMKNVCVSLYVLVSPCISRWDLISPTPQSSTVQCSIAQYSTVQYGTVQYSTVRMVVRGQGREGREGVRGEGRGMGGEEWRVKGNPTLARALAVDA